MAKVKKQSKTAGQLIEDAMHYLNDAVDAAGEAERRAEYAIDELQKLMSTVACSGNLGTSVDLNFEALELLRDLERIGPSCPLHDRIVQLLCQIECH